MFRIAVSIFRIAECTFRSGERTFRSAERKKCSLTIYVDYLSSYL